MITTTPYYEEFLRYVKMAGTQQRECNLGTIAHEKGSVKDPLMRHVRLYDVVERKYAGFTQLLLDIRYGNSKDHPYQHNLHDVRKPICENFAGWRQRQSLVNMLYVFIVHRVTGSAINYAKSPSGYHNTVLPTFYQANSIKEMARLIKLYDRPKFTSVGYQFPAFPQPSLDYVRGGDYFLCELAPKLAVGLAKFLERGPKKTLRQVGEWMFAWNRDQGLRAYKFQYAAVIADIADFYPNLVDVYSPFYYGTNAIECIGYMATSTKLRGDDLRDAVMERASADTGFSPYNVEDQMCDCIRWIENYCRPGGDYNHLDLDKLWGTSKIIDHPFGRQRHMLKLGLVKTFNDLGCHPSDDYVISRAGLTAEQYRELVRKSK